MLARRIRYRESLEKDIAMLEGCGCHDGTLAQMKERLACIRWLESRRDPRPLDAETMAEYRRSWTEQKEEGE